MPPFQAARLEVVEGADGEPVVVLGVMRALGEVVNILNLDIGLLVDVPPYLGIPLVQDNIILGQSFFLCGQGPKLLPSVI